LNYRDPSSPRESALSRWDSPFARGALLVVAVLLAYLPAFHCGYIWDDDMYVTGNPLLYAHDGLWRIWFSFDSPSQYFPLVYTTFRVEYGLWKLAPLGYHCVNILLHGVNALLLWRLLERLKVPGAWFAAAVFALHPVQVESVAWITELKNVEMGFFFLLSVQAWISFYGEGERRRWGWYGLSLLLYALSLFSKTTACTMPAALLIILWVRGERIGWRRVAEVVPYGLLGVGMGLLTVWWERYHQGTQGKLFSIGLFDRVLISTRNVWFYLYKLIWPAKLTFSYPRWALPPAEPWAVFWLIALCGVAAGAYLWRGRLGRGVFAALAYFVIMLGPILGVLMLYTFRYSFVADHYQYLACIGPMALVSAGGAVLGTRRPEWRWLLRAAGGLILLVLAGLTWEQCHIYANDQSIWVDTLAKNPGSLMAHYNLANGLMRQGDYPQSLAQYDDAVKLDPEFFEARCNRGDLLAHLGRLPEAAADYAKAVEIQPGSSVIQNSYGLILRRMGKLGDAAERFREAERLQPGSGVAEKNLGDTLAAEGDYAGALTEYQEVARVYPDQPGAHILLAKTYGALKRYAEAIRECEAAIQAARQSQNPGGAIAEALADGRLAIDGLRRSGDQKSAAEFEKEMSAYESAPAQGRQ
jgi:tetratricopeptide (TPR) repeat protein